jgi:hypothetical protein
MTPGASAGRAASATKQAIATGTAQASEATTK